MFAVNTIGLALVLEHLLPLLARDSRAVLAAIGLRCGHRHATCVALHPGTVNMPRSAPFSKARPGVQEPNLAAVCLLGVIAGLAPEDSGEFFNHHGKPVPG
jgi:hypothetical protein